MRIGLLIEGDGGGAVASALATWPAIAPAVKIGPATPAASDHAVAGPLRKFVKRARSPIRAMPVRLNCG